MRVRLRNLILVEEGCIEDSTLLNDDNSKHILIKQIN